MSKETIVSVIIPVYQVEAYLDQCIRSVVDQTFRDIEILLIAKKGTDRSYDICWDWEKRDERIRVIDQMGKGLGDARNLGIEESRGEYLCFVDSDDWLDEHYLEELLYCIQEEKADWAECEFWLYTSEEEKVQSDNYELRKALGQNMWEVFGEPEAWKMLSKRSLWIENAIRFPNAPAEDFAVYMLLFSVSRTVGSVDKPLYYYRIREESLAHVWPVRIEQFEVLLISFKYIIDSHKRIGRFKEKKNELLIQLVYGIRSHINIFGQKFGHEIYKNCLTEVKKLIQTNYGETVYEQRILVWGSYNLGRIANMYCLEPPEENRYSFSSLISLMSEQDTTVFITHKNFYRETALQRETGRSFRQKEILENTDYILLDFLEERFNIIQSGDAYFTKSDAFDESENNIRIDRIIKRDSEECRALFRRSCKEFMDVLADYPQIKVILFENFLCEKRGKYEETSEFENIEEIRATNNLLKECYEFFEKEYPDVPVIRMERQDLNYTDKDFRYGCYPWHMNRYAYISIGQQLKDYIMTD